MTLLLFLSSSLALKNCNKRKVSNLLVKNGLSKAKADCLPLDLGQKPFTKNSITGMLKART